MIALPMDLAENEIQRNLDKKDCDYKIIDDELQYFNDDIGKRTIRKVAIWSDKKDKMKIFFFI